MKKVTAIRPVTLTRKNAWNIRRRQITTNPSNVYRYLEENAPQIPSTRGIHEKEVPRSDQSFRDILENISVQKILETKPENWRGVFMVDSDAPCVDAIRQMSYKNIGSVVVCGHSTKQPVGIFTERDYLNKLIVKGLASTSTRVKHVMTADPLVISPGYNLETVASIMASCNIRHLPVSTDLEQDAIDGDEGSLIGMVSARDVCFHMVRAAEAASDIDLLKHTVADVFEKMGRKTSETCYVGEDETVFDALKIMTENNIGGVFVVSGQSLAGIFTERDYLHDIFLKGRSSKNTKIGEVMKTDVISVDPYASLHECLNMMARNSIRTLPLVPLSGGQINDAEKASMIGMITFLDVIRFLELAQGTGLRDPDDMKNVADEDD